MKSRMIENLTASTALAQHSSREPSGDPSPGDLGSSMMAPPVTRRALLLGGAAAVVRARLATAQSPTTPLELDDASRLNRVSVARHWRPAQVNGEAGPAAPPAQPEPSAQEGQGVTLG